MYSMIATAPESIQQRRRLQTGASPKQSPSDKPSSRNSPLPYQNILSSSGSDPESITPDNSSIPVCRNPATAVDEKVEKCGFKNNNISQDRVETLVEELENDGSNDAQNDSISQCPLGEGGISPTNNDTSGPAEKLESLSLLDAEVESDEFIDFETEREAPEPRSLLNEQILRNDGGGVDMMNNIPDIFANNLSQKTPIQYTRSWSIEPKVEDVRSDFDHSGEIEYLHNQQFDCSESNESEQNESGTFRNDIISGTSSDERGLFQSPVNGPTETHNAQTPSSEQVNEFNRSEIPSLRVEEAEVHVHDCTGDAIHMQPLVLKARSVGVSLFANSNSSDAASSVFGGDNDDEEDAISTPPYVSRSFASDHSPLFFTSSNSAIGNKNDEGEIDDNCKERTNDNATRSISQTNLSLSDYVGNSRHQYDHTHSLLDDCSDEEDEITSVASTSYGRSFSCFPKRQINSGNESYYSYFKKQKQKKDAVDSNNSAQIRANEVASKNIQLCMLKTRHRRWTCQSALAGPHAQSDQVLDLSQRVVHYPMRLANHRHNNEQHTLNDDGEVTFLARLSVPGAAIRAASLASGIWRTVRLVRLPRGLFGWHWLLWQEINGLQGWEFRSKGQRDNDGGIEDNDVWSLLKMLGELFPMMDQIDFGGDVAHSNESFTVQERNTGTGAISSRDSWKKEIRLRVLKCLPNLIAIDGFDVVREDIDAESCNEVTTRAVEEVTDPNNSLDKQSSFEEVDLDQSSDNISNNLHLSDKRNTPMAQNSRACVDCDSVEVSMMCGWSDLVGNTFNENVATPMKTTAELPYQNVIEASSTGIHPDQCDIAADMLASDAIEDVSENVMTIVDNSVAYSNSDDLDHNAQIASNEVDASPDQNPEHSDLPTTPSSSLLSSRSWSSNGSGTRPPTCPSSSSRHRIPTNPREKRNSKSSLTKAKYWKRRVLGLIPTVSVMDEDDDDEENEADNVDDCPHDIL